MPGGMLMAKYLKFYLTPFLVVLITLSLLMSGGWMWSGMIISLILVVGGDSLLKKELSSPQFSHVFWLELPLFLSLPLLTLVLLALAWNCSQFDFLRIGQVLSLVTGRDWVAARNANSAWNYVGGVLTAGITVAAYGTNSAHELAHQFNKKAYVQVSRWVLSMSANPDFSIEHVFGHHVNVATDQDPASARLGENVYSFFVRSTVMGHLSAWKIERARLKKKRQSVLLWHNQMLTGYAMTLCWIALFGYAGGAFGIFIFFCQAVFAKFLLEVVNYMEHYGLKRKKGQAVRPEHSWNSNHPMSYYILYSLVRHSAHHERAQVRFWKLNPYPKSPEMPYGYFTTVLLCLLPPFWFASIHPRLEQYQTLRPALD